MKAWLLGLALLAPFCWAQNTADVEFMQGSPLGCFEKGFVYDYYIPNVMINTTSLELCQKHCQTVPGCVKFAYFAFYGECWFADANAVEKPLDSNLVIAGYRTCTPEGMQLPPRCRTEVPGNGFPAGDPFASNAAWPGGKQPSSLECWPKAWNGQVLPCSEVAVLDDTTNGWPGKCHGLVEMSGVNGTEACKASCRNNPKCPSWQSTVYYSCWQGLGKDCFVRDSWQPREAQRLQHGSVRVLMDLTGWQIVGLYKAFDNAEGYFTNNQDAIAFCKHTCYSDISCQYWTYAPNYGCWVEDASQEYSPQFPLTLGSAKRDTSFALDCVAGEYIQHFCPAGMVSRVLPTPPPTLSECAEYGYRYEPVDMAGSRRTVESSYEACRQRCSLTLFCTYFAYWPDGGCHVVGDTAHKVVAESYQVISGPKDCSLMYTSTSPHPEAWMFKTTVAPSAVQRDIVFTDSTAHLAEIRTIIHNLDDSKLTTADRNLLKAKYAEAIAKTLGMPVAEIKDSPESTALVGQVGLYNKMPTGTELKAYTLNQPVNSPDPSLLQSKVEVPMFAANMKEATTAVLGTSSPALMGGGIAIARPEVGTREHPLTKLPDHPNGSWWGSWWPLILALVIVILAACLFITHQMIGRDRYKQMTQSRRTFSADSDGQSDPEMSSVRPDPSVWDQPPQRGPQGSYRGYQPQPAPYSSGAGSQQSSGRGGRGGQFAS